MYSDTLSGYSGISIKRMAKRLAKYVHYNEVCYIKVLLYQVYRLLTICLPQDELYLHGKQLMSLSLDLLSTVT